MTKLITAVAIACLIVGCRSDKIQVIESDNHEQGVKMQSSGFSGKTYIWENWTYSTNRVDR